jgi:hypothetical protein
MSDQHGSTNDSGGAEGPPTYTPPPAGDQPQAPPLSEPANLPPAPAPRPGSAGQLEPGRGAPLVAGPPRSVSDPINAGKVNTVFGIGGVIALVAIIIVVILVGLLLISLLTHH